MELRTDTSSYRLNGHWELGPRPTSAWDTHSLPGYGYHYGQNTASSRPPSRAFAAPMRGLLSQFPSSRQREGYMSSNVYNSPPTSSHPVIPRVQPSDTPTYLIHTRRRVSRDMSDNGTGKAPQLPPIHEFSIDGILEAIEPDIQGTIDAIAEILGRSRYSLANEYGAHMPPQGEIRAPGRGTLDRHLLPVEEASSSNERLAADNVIIVGEDPSLIDGSHAGSGAYDLLERIRAVNNVRRPRNRTTGRPVTVVENDLSRPATPQELVPSITVAPRRSSANHLALLQDGGSRNVPTAIAVQTTVPVTSSMHLLAGANGVVADPPIVTEGDRSFPLYSFDEAHVFETTAAIDQAIQSSGPGFRIQNLSMIHDMQSIVAWLHRSTQATMQGDGASARDRLRSILERHDGAAAVSQAESHPAEEESDMYGAD